MSRIMRIAKGLLNANTRPRYVAALKRKLGIKAPTVPCILCGGAASPERIVRSNDPTSILDVQRCTECGYVGIPHNVKDYLLYTSLDQFPITNRVGTPERPGREFSMAQMAVELMRDDNLEVLIFGCGASADFMHVGKLPGVGRVTITDVQNAHGAPNFIELGKLPEGQFDLIIACEVVEHFTEPRGEFRSMLAALAPGGIAVCSTNIYDGSDIAKHNYAFLKGHTSYYAPKALHLVAAENDLFVDFRVPKVATGFAGPRKRYVFFTSSVSRLQDIARYFGSHTYAPSESPAKKGAASLSD